nr:metallophosphoesterase [Oleomonas cavernae]
MPVPSTVRAFAIGDVHGLSRALRSAFLEVARRAADGGPDHLVMLGDYIDRGPHSRGVMAQVIAGIAGVKITALAGNHEGVMAAACDSGDPRDMHLWLANGGSSVMNELGLPLTATAREAWPRSASRSGVSSIPSGITTWKTACFSFTPGSIPLSRSPNRWPGPGARFRAITMTNVTRHFGA